MRDPIAPPPGPPWDQPMPEAPLAFVDLEMTGLDAERDRVVEVCIERVVGRARVDGVLSLLRPERRAGGAAHVHGLDEAALDGAPPFSALVDDIVRVLDGAVLVAHAAEWDVRFLGAEFSRTGRAWSAPHYLDTLVLARRAFALPSYSLDVLCKHLHVERGRAHRAEADVRALRAVFDGCVALLAPSTPRDLWEVRIAERRARTAIVHACETAAEHGTAVDLTYRPSRRTALVIRAIITEVQHDKMPPHVVGYELPGRGRRELRADRILKIAPAQNTDEA